MPIAWVGLFGGQMVVVEEVLEQRRPQGSASSMVLVSRLGVQVVLVVLVVQVVVLEHVRVLWRVRVQGRVKVRGRVDCETRFLLSAKV